MGDFFSNFNNMSQTQFTLGEFSVLLLLISFIGGVISSLSPCTLGILPIIMGYVLGYSEKNTSKTFVQLVFFVLGLSFVMSIIGLISVLFGRVFTSLGGDYFILLIASLLMVLGLDLIGVLEINFPQLINKMPSSNTKSLFVYPFLTGSVFALASTPCSTPILIGIMSFAGLSKNVFYAVLLLFLFALGQGIIIILAGVFTSFLSKLKNFAKYSEIFLKFAGVLLILSSILIYYKIFSQFF